jgi:hypothetical protein
MTDNTVNNYKKLKVKKGILVVSCFNYKYQNDII